MGISRNLRFLDVRNEIAHFLTSPSLMILFRTLNDELMRSPACEALRGAQTLLTSR
jgi:hypothetical protein